MKISFGIYWIAFSMLQSFKQPYDIVFNKEVFELDALLLMAFKISLREKYFFERNILY